MKKKIIVSSASLILVLSGCGNGAFTEVSDFLEQNNYNQLSKSGNSSAEGYRFDGENIRILLQSDEHNMHIDVIYAVSMGSDNTYGIHYKTDTEKKFKLKNCRYNYYVDDEYTSDKYTDAESCKLIETKMLEGATEEEIDTWNNTKDLLL